MTLASELRTFVAAFHECGRSGLAQDLAALSNRVASLEKAWDETVQNAAESADAAERHALLNGASVLPFRSRLRLVGTEWSGPAGGVQ